MSQERDPRLEPFGESPNGRELTSFSSPIRGETEVSETLRRLLRNLEAHEPELRLGTRCADVLREEAYLLDLGRLRARTAALLAWRLVGTERTLPTPEEVHQAARRAIRDLLAEDREGPEADSHGANGRAEGATGDGRNGHHEFLVRVFALDPTTARHAAVRFNGLDAGIRKAFTALLIEGRSIEECELAGLGSAHELGSRARSGLRALFLLDGEPGENGKAETPNP